MRIIDSFESLSDMFDLSAHDWCELLNLFEELPPRKRKALINNEFEELAFTK